MSLDKTDFQRNIKDTVNLSKESAQQIKERLSSINKENVEWARKFSQMFAEGKMSFEDYKLNMDTVRSSMSEVNKEFDELGFSSEEAGDKVEKNIGTIALNAVMNLASMALKAASNIKQMFLNTIDYADKYGDLSAKYDISTKSLQKFEYIASQSGATLEEVLNIMAMMYNKAKTEGNEAFNKIGVSVRDVNGNMKTMDALFWEVKKALDNVTNSGDKSAIMMELFGRNAMSLGEFLRKDADELEYLGNKAEELGIIMEESTIDTAGKFNDLLDEMKLRGQTAFAELIMGAEGAEEKFEDFMEDVTAIVETFIPVFADIGLELGEELLKGFIKGVGEKLWSQIKFSVGEGWIWGEKKYDNFGEWFMKAGFMIDPDSPTDISGALDKIKPDEYTQDSSSSNNAPTNNYQDNSQFNVNIDFKSNGYSEEDAKELANLIIKEIATQKQASGR